MVDRKICIVTGARSEYGLLRPLMERVRDTDGLALQVVVTGAHLSDAHGQTWRQIESDGLPIDKRVPFLLDADSPRAACNGLGLAVIGFAEAFEALRPEIVVLLGDRYEILAAAQAAMIFNLPIAHLHGGEATEGVIDEAVRHAVTKMAHFHFVAAEPYRNRVIQMGENPDRVFNVGALAVAALDALKPMTLAELSASVGADLAPRFLLVTYHPLTLDQEKSAREFDALLAALDALPEFQVLFTGVNADPGRDYVAGRVHEYVSGHPRQAMAADTLGQHRYLNAVRLCAAVVGNSSSGIIEAPALKTPTVNIGERQKGRLRAPSVVDCPGTRDAIENAVRSVSESAFRKTLKDHPYLFGSGDVVGKIVSVLRDHRLDGILQKRFYDLDVAPRRAETIESALT